MKFIPPIATNTNAIIPETNVAGTGSCSLPTPKRNNLFKLGIGITLSLASACSVLGATIIDPRAEDSDAAPNPI